MKCACTAALHEEDPKGREILINRQVQEITVSVHRGYIGTALKTLLARSTLSISFL